MTTLHNEITIDAPLEKIWSILTDLEALERYDPTVQRSQLVSAQRTGLGAKRKVTMKDGKNWFEEHMTLCREKEELAYELTNCSFPIHSLRHTYSFANASGRVRVQQVMEYEVKFGMFGKLLDAIMIRRQTDKGIKLFFEGLKRSAETK